MTYQDQLLHPKWQIRRLKIIKRDKGTCQECGCKEIQLHVHHKRYISGRMAWEYQDWELTTVCKDCHAQKHPKKQEEPVKPKEKTTQEIRDIIRHFEGELRMAELRERFAAECQNPVSIDKARSIFANVRAKLG